LEGYIGVIVIGRLFESVREVAGVCAPALTTGGIPGWRPNLPECLSFFFFIGMVCAACCSNTFKILPFNELGSAAIGASGEPGEVFAGRVGKDGKDILKRIEGVLNNRKVVC
jgi:hypothetical protein